MKVIKITNVNLVVNYLHMQYAHSLKEHIHTVHEGHKDYKCDSCGKSFTGGQYLKMHIHNIHEGIKDHKCYSCGRSFAQAGYLNIHIYTVIIHCPGPHILGPTTFQPSIFGPYD